MGSDTPLLDILAVHLPPAVALPAQSRDVFENLLAFALGADCPTRLSNARNDWSRTQPAALNALQNALGPRAQKRTRDAPDTADGPTPKRQKTDDADDPPRFTLPSISTTSPVRKKVDVTVHTHTIRFVNPSTRALEASIPLANIARAFLLPTRGKTRGHWTVVLLPADVPDKGKTSPTAAQQVIMGLDALSTTAFETTSYPSTSAPTTTAIPKGQETAPTLRALLAHIPIPLLEPSSAVFRSACAGPRAGHGAAGIDAYLAAKAGTLWFLDGGILWGESKPCVFWPVEALVPKDGVRLISATGRTCSVILTRRAVAEEGDGEDGEEDMIETTFSMVDGKEQDPIDAWVRHRKHLFGKGVPASNVGARETCPTRHVGNGTVKGPAWDDSDSDDADFEAASSEDLEHSSTDEDEGEVKGADESGSEEEGESGEEFEEEELDEARHPLLRPGAMPRISKAAIDAVVDMVHRDLIEDASEEEDELEE